MAPKLAIGDGSLGFWLALQEEYAQLRKLAERLGGKIGRFPKKLKASAKQAAAARAADVARRADLERACKKLLRTLLARV